MLERYEPFESLVEVGAPKVTLVLGDEVDGLTLTATSTVDGEAYEPGSWANRPVTVTFICVSDSTEIEEFTPPVLLADEGADQVTEGYCRDALGREATLTVEGVNIDLTPPEIISNDITVVTTDASGATVDYEALVSDNLDDEPVLTCSPVSGATFPIGTTEVECEAVDHAGNTASAALVVTVLTVDDQLQELLDLSSSATRGESLARSVRSAQRWLEEGNTVRACSDLDTLVATTETRRGRNQVSETDAEIIIIQAHRLQRALGCKE